MKMLLRSEKHTIRVAIFKGFWFHNSFLEAIPLEQKKGFWYNGIFHPLLAFTGSTVRQQCPFFLSFWSPRKPAGELFCNFASVTMQLVRLS